MSPGQKRVFSQSGSWWRTLPTGVDDEVLEQGAGAVGVRGGDGAGYCTVGAAQHAAAAVAAALGLTLVNFRLNVSDLYGIGGAIMGCLRGAQGVFRGMRRCLRCVLCQKRLRLSCKVDESKPLPPSPPPPPPPPTTVAVPPPPTALSPPSAADVPPPRSLTAAAATPVLNDPAAAAASAAAASAAAAAITSPAPAPTPTALNPPPPNAGGPASPVPATATPPPPCPKPLPLL